MTVPQSHRIRPRRDDDQAWIEDILGKRWGGSVVVVHNGVFEPAKLPALIAEPREGLVTYQVRDHVAEVVTLDAFAPRQGVGTALLAGLVDVLRRRGCRSLCLTTTNDNVDALRFYQRRGFRLAAIRIGAVEQARRLKPVIPLIARHGIPMRDEIDLRCDLTERPSLDSRTPLP
jgi:GNAT superfamily N-acetyltransferase